MKKTLIFSFLITTVLFSCTNNSNKKVNQKLKIVCTTGMLGDVVSNIVKNKAEVITLMGTGVDPHLYKATQGDLKHLSSADIIVYNGLHLEGKMGEVFEKLGKRKNIIVASKGVDEIELINNSDFQGAYDPHLWFDVKLWSKVVYYIGNQIISYRDSLKTEISVNSSNYIEQLLSLDKKVRSDLATIDSSKRVLITAHDAFSYFGRAYDIKVKGLQGISTVSEYGLKDISELVNYITEKEIKAVFVESSVSDRSLKAVVEGCKARGHEVKIGGTLFSDAMGEKDSMEGTYIGMVNYNVRTIVESLK